MKILRSWKRRLVAAGLAALTTCAPVLPAAPFAARAEASGSADVIAALAGVLGTAGMYGSYLAAILDAGNNAYYQEQTRLYDAEENGVDRNPMDHQIVDEVMGGLVERGKYVLDIRSLPFRWNVNDSTEFNAACFPTNYITVNKGLVVGLNGNIDEIAGVLAHEMTHGIKLHAAYTYARAAAQAFGINFLGMVTGAVRPDVVGVLADYSVAKNVILPAEYEADEGGFYLAASAGFNPGGPAAAMARMDYMTKHPDTFDRSYGADPYDHPDTDKREEKLAAMMSEYGASHVTVKDRKEILIDGQPLLAASYSTDTYDDTPEQAYLIAGGLARAFHEYSTAEGWNFRPGANGRIDYLDDSRVYEYLKDAVERNHAEAELERLVRAAYAGEAASGAREKMLAAESERLAFWQERATKNAAADRKLVERLYKNADAYNDINEPELSIEEGARTFGCEQQDVKLAGIYAVRGRAKALNGDFVGAMEDCDYAVNLDPKDAYVYLNRAEVQRAMGLPDAALSDIRRCIALDAKSIAAHKMAADVEDELGNTEAALADYANYHKLAPDATDIPDEYYKRIDPKRWERMEKERKKQEEKAKKEREEKKAAVENAGKEKDAKQNGTAKAEAKPAA
ncbi:MAG: M48 family metalloprotease [Schwartzia sp.]|nr:M48 family metalloprotease [Schwartzia sp. (in: firmicutes)]